MSTSDDVCETAFDRWVRDEVADGGPFTALAVLVQAGDPPLPLCATWMDIADAQTEWGEMVLRFAGSGLTWDGVFFFAERAGAAGLLDNPTALRRLEALQASIDASPDAWRGGRGFDAAGAALGSCTA